MLVVSWNETQRTESYRIGQNGIAYPGPMFDNARREGLDITFNPSSLQSIAVCEWSVARGRTWSEFSQDYLTKYPMCFVVRRMSEKAIAVYPANLGAHWSKLQYNPRTNTYWCKCPPEIASVE